MTLFPARRRARTAALTLCTSVSTLAAAGLVSVPLAAAEETPPAPASEPAQPTSAAPGADDPAGSPAEQPAEQPVERTVVINEIESNGDPDGDWVELANLDNTESADVSGWTLIDNDPKHAPITLPAGTEIESGGYLVVFTDKDDSGFGLGGKDSVTLADASGAVIDSYEWTKHAETTYARVPNGTGDFAESASPSRGLRNPDAGDTEGSVTATAAWPWEAKIQDVKLASPLEGVLDAFADEDMSGIDFDAKGNAYIVNNSAGDLYVLSPEPAGAEPGLSYTVRQHTALRYPDGSGLPDAEGITVAADGSLYVATERNNESKKVSRPSVLKFAPLPADAQAGSAPATLPALAEYPLGEFTGEIDANGGLEAIESLGGDTFAVGVEETGDVLVVDLTGEGDDASATLRSRFESPFAGVMALDYDEKNATLLALCDEACGGLSTPLRYDAAAGQLFATGEIYSRPEGMGNFANEGFAAFRGGNEVVFLWADDAVTDGISLRGAVYRDGESETPGEGKPEGTKPDELAAIGANLLGGLLTVGVFAAIVGFFNLLLHNGLRIPTFQEFIDTIRSSQSSR